MDLILSNFKNFTHYLKYIKKFSDETVKAYSKDLLIFKSYLEKHSLASTFPTPVEVKGFLRSLHQNYHPNTIYRIRCALSSFFKYLIEQKIILSSPLDGLFPLKRRKSLPNFISRPTVNQIATTLSNEIKQGAKKNPTENYLLLRDQLIWELLYGLGLRISEVSHLTLAKIDLSQKNIIILGKRKSLTLLPLTSLLSQLIATYLPQRLVFLNSKKKNHSHLLLNHLGDPITIRGVRYSFMSRLKKNQVSEKIYPHSLRHSIATHLLENGADIKRVQQLLRHQSIETTQIYTHLSKKNLKATYQKFHPLAHSTP